MHLIPRKSVHKIAATHTLWLPSEVTKGLTDQHTFRGALWWQETAEPERRENVVFITQAALPSRLLGMICKQGTCHNMSHGRCVSSPLLVVPHTLEYSGRDGV